MDAHRPGTRRRAARWRHGDAAPRWKPTRACASGWPVHRAHAAHAVERARAQCRHPRRTPRAWRSAHGPAAAAQSRSARRVTIAGPSGERSVPVERALCRLSRDHARSRRTDHAVARAGDGRAPRRLPQMHHALRRRLAGARRGRGARCRARRRIFVSAATDRPTRFIAAERILGGGTATMTERCARRHTSCRSRATCTARRPTRSSWRRCT